MIIEYYFINRKFPIDKHSNRKATAFSQLAHV